MPNSVYTFHYYGGRHSLPCLPWRHVTDFLLFKILSNLRLPWKKSLSWNFSLYWNIFYLSGFLSNLCLPWKTECALNSPYWMYFLSFTILNNLSLPWKTESSLEFFTELKYFLSFRIFEKLELALTTEFALNFSSREGGRPRASYATGYWRVASSAWHGSQLQSSWNSFNRASNQVVDK